MLALEPGADRAVDVAEMVEPANSSGLAPFLRTRVDEIVADHFSAKRLAGQAILHAARCGRSLIALKDDLAHGEFIPFIEENFPFTRQTASGYMRIAGAVDAGELQMEDACSIRGALKQLAAPKERSAPAESAVNEGSPAKPTYVVDTDRKRQLADKAEERFWAVTGHITGLEEIGEMEGQPLGEILHLDRVLAVADHDQLHEQLEALGRGIRRARDLYDELAEALGEV